MHIVSILKTENLVACKFHWKQWQISYLIFTSVVLSGISGALGSLVPGYFPNLTQSDEPILLIVISGIFTLLPSITFCTTVMFQGFLKSLSIGSLILVGPLVSVAFSRFVSYQFSSIPFSFFEGLQALSLVSSSLLSTMLAHGIILLVSRIKHLVIFLILSSTVFGAFIVHDRGRMDIAIGIGVSLSLFYLGSHIARLAFADDTKFSWLKSSVIIFSSFGRTRFSGVDLTEVDFTGAYLMNIDLRGAKILRTYWLNAQGLNCTQLGNSYLRNPNVRQLVTTLQGDSQSFDELNMEGVNLSGANLRQASFVRTNLNQASLRHADLSGVNLKQTQLDNTDFSGATLTGACIEDWGITSTTRIEESICDYVYLLHNQQERRPHSGTFSTGEFAKLFQEVFDTIDFIFQHGIDWKAFTYAFREIQGKYEGANLAVQTIENKGEGVVVIKLQTALEVDKPQIHQSFTEVYQLALQKAEDCYRAQLEAKDEQITEYRQQSANMQEVVKLLAQRPINVDVKATAESQTLHGNDYSRRIDVRGDATGNIFQVGDANTSSAEI